MTLTQIVRCPNCGSLAQRHYISGHPNLKRSPSHTLIQTECFACDYFIVTCASSGDVLEAYAPGLSKSVGLATASG